jgi:RsiW-degrading membrane proteinase PrsW (M82 family)
MLFALALIPVVILLIFIYKKDKKEKEPMGLLMGLFFAGAGTVISALILESIGELIFGLIFPYESALKVFLSAMLVIGPAEEFGKFMVLKLITWKNKNFDYSYDAIVYAVFASLGFAAVENIFYVFGNGWGVAILRMFTAIPGHASFAVFMGYFYSRAKYAELTNNKSDRSKYLFRAWLIPTIIHGLYDAIILGGTSTESLLMVGSSIILWVVLVIILFVMSIITVIKASRNDFCITWLPGNVQTVYVPSVAGMWVCECGMNNQLNFCPKCGKMRPVSNVWTCPRCGIPSAYNFCGQCGCPRQ